MNFVASYIIRIYRFEKDHPKNLVGVVLEAGKKGKKAFQSCDELWEILNSAKEEKPLEKANPPPLTPTLPRGGEGAGGESGVRPSAVS